MKVGDMRGWRDQARSDVTNVYALRGETIAPVRVPIEGPPAVWDGTAWAPVIEFLPSAT